MATMTEIQAVLAGNKQQQIRARDLNTRAGAQTFKIWASTELEDWLRVRTNGAVNAATVLDASVLTLPALDEAQVAEVLAMNPDEVEVAGQIAKVVYSKDYYSSNYTAKVSLDSATVLILQATPILPSGRALTMVTTYEGKSFELSDLGQIKAQIEARRIEKAWEMARQAHEGSSYDYLGKLDQIEPKLPLVLTQVEVTKDSNGEPVFAYISLYAYRGYGAQLKLRKTREEAERETAQYLLVLYQHLTKDHLVVPQEEPFQKKSESWYNSWDMTDAGNALKARLDQIGSPSDLTLDNFVEKVAGVQTQVQAAKAEIGGRYVAVKDTIANTETAVNAKVDAIEYDNRSLVETEIKAIKAKVEAVKAEFRSGKLDEAEIACLEATELAEALQKTLETRLAAKDAAQTAKAEVTQTLNDIRCYYTEYADADSEESAAAGQIYEAIREADRYNHFDEVVAKAEEARQLIAQVNARLATWGDTVALIEEHVAEAYSHTEFYDREDMRVDEQVSIDRYHPLFDELKEQIDSANDYKLRLIESRLNGEPVAWLEAQAYGRREIEFTVRRTRTVSVQESDLEKIEVVALWQPPSGDEALLKQLKREVETYAEAEADAKAQVEAEYVFVLTFREGKHPRTGEPQLEVGNKHQKYIVDAWSALKPVVGKRYYCREKKEVVNTGSFRLVAVEPFLEAGRNIALEIMTVEARLRATSETQSEDSTAVNAEQLATAQISEDFKVLGDGYVRCIPCNYTNQAMPKKEWKALTAGSQVPVFCSQCSRTGNVQK